MSLILIILVVLVVVGLLVFVTSKTNADLKTIGLEVFRCALLALLLGLVLGHLGVDVRR